MSRITRNHMFMKMAQIASQRATCLRKQVGAVIVKDYRPISIGYNGAPSGMPHCTPDICNDQHPCDRTIHAEINAIAFAAREGLSIEGATLYVTLQPCYECSKTIINSGIKKVYFMEKYRDLKGVDYLIMSGVKVEQYMV